MSLSGSSLDTLALVVTGRLIIAAVDTGRVWRGERAPSTRRHHEMQVERCCGTLLCGIWTGCCNG
jgi:hypothetical protein